MTLIDSGPSLLDAAQVGHKFSRLEALRAEGLPVPELFCLPATDFDRALDAVRDRLGPIPLPGNASGPDGEGRDATTAWCAAAARELTAYTPDEQWAARLYDAFDRQFGADGLAAVRACVVPAADGTAEDSADDPFAGMSESFLYVPREGLLRAVAGCWASAFTARAVGYRQLRGTDPTAARVAVGIQQMVLGTRSFVAFTRDPRDAARHHVIAAAHGIGEGVVQERADVDHFFVDPVTGAVRAETVEKKRMVGPPERRGEALSILPVPEELAVPPVLTDADARAITRLAERVEGFFGNPQDIEGTITPDGAVHLVQARPLALGTVSGTEAESRVIWGNHNITESFPGVSGALTYSQARVFYQLGLTDFYRRMRVPERILRAESHRLSHMIAYLNGRIYYRLNDWQALHGQMPVFDLIRSGWEEGMGITGEVRAERRWSRARVAASLPAIAWHALGHRRATRRTLRWWDALMEDVYPRDGADADRSPEDLVALYRRVWAQVGEHWGVTLVNSVYGLLILRTGTTLIRRWTGAGPELLVGLMAGGAENRSLASVRAAIALAEHAGADPELRAALLTEQFGDAGEEEYLRTLWQKIAGGEYGTETTERFAEYLRRFGDRTLHDLKLDEPTPRQQPWRVAALVRPLLRQGETVAGSRAKEAKAAQDARTRLRANCPNPARRTVLRVAVALMRWCVRAREDARFCRTQLFGFSREVLWQLGAQLASAGLLDDGRDVVDLTVEEVLGAFDGTLAGAGLRDLAALRRAEREGFADAPALPVLMSTAAGLPIASALKTARPVGAQDAEADSGALLRGLGSSGGVVRAQAKVVLDPGIDPDTCRGHILVARETDPGWLFLMTAAAGLIVERGTLLSHTAITGRLLGVPTAVAVHGATERIPDGAWIELDGAAGTVTLLQDPADDASKEARRPEHI